MPLTFTNNYQQQKPQQQTQRPAQQQTQQFQLPKPQQIQTPVVTQKTAYQQNVSNQQQAQNAKWYKGTLPTAAEMYGQIYQLSQTDPTTAAKAASAFMQLQQDSSSPWFNPYGQPTNQAVNVLQSYGIDTNMLTDEWFQNNTAWQQSLRYGNTTNTPLAPTAKGATDDQIVAFNLYQYQYSEPTTKKAEQEWAALQQELTYKATRKDRNYSDDDIINSIDWNKYQTLKTMNDGKTKGAVTELNRAVDFSDDSMRGVLWAARNGGSSGYIVKDMAMYGLGEGNKWVEDPEMRAKLAWGNPETYSPYQVGMTLDEEVGMYFNVPYIDRQTLNHLRATIDDSDKTSMSMFNRAAKSVDNAEKAQEQRDKLYAWIDKNIGNKSEEWLLKNLDVKLGNKDYAMLKAMDESIDNGSELVQMGTAVDYRKQDVIDYIRRKKAELGGNGTAPDIANGTAGSAKTKEQVQQEAEDIHRRNRIKDQEYTGTEKDAYDSVYGEGAYQRDIAAAESLTSQSQAQKDSDQYVNDTVGDIEDELTPGESSRLNGYSGASDQAQQTVKANKEAMVSGEESPDAIAQKNNEEITKGWIEGTVDIYPRTIKYEQTQANLDFAKKQIEDINAKLGDKVFAGQTQDTSFTMEINGDLYRITLSQDLSEIEAIDNVNKSDTPVPVYANFGLYDSPEEYDADTQVWDAVEKSGQVEAFREKYAQETEKINAANKLEITDEDRELMKLKRRYEIQVEDAEQYLRDYKNQYEADITVFKRLSERRAAHIQNLKDMGASTTEVETADAALTALTGFTSYEATQWDYYNPSYAYAHKIENGEDKNTVLQLAEAEHEEMLEQIKDIEWLKGYCDRHNIEIGNDVRKNMDRRIAKLQRDTQDYEYFRLQFSDDFDKVAEEQRKIDEKISSEYIASHVMNDTHLPQGTLFYDFNGYDRYLTDDEKNTWYYLKAKDEQNGTNKAEEYAKFMMDDTYGVLMTRAAMGIEEGAKALTGQKGTAGLGFTAGNITAVLLSPYTAVASGIYRAKTLFTGEEINPNSRYLQTMKFRSAVREQSAQEILETFGKPIVDEKTGKVTGYESNLLSKGVQMVYEVLSNRADSMINAASFGWIFGGVGNEVLRELLSASPMGMSAGMEAAARAKERGATDAQASAIGFITFLAETGTEAISIKDMREAGEITGPGAYKQFLVNWLTKAGINEMVGESINDIVENLADEWIMGELSEHAETVYQYRLSGMSADEAEMAARKDEVKGVLRTALMSYLTPGLDVFQTMRGRMGYFSEATDKLNAENPDKKLTIRQVRKQIVEEERSEARKQREEKQKQKEEAKGPASEPGEIDYDALEERYAPEQTKEEKAATEEAKTAEEEAKVKEGKQNTVDFEILETAKTYDKAGKSAAIAAVLDEGSTQDETDTANAASVRLDKIMGPNADPSSELQDLLLGAKVANGDISTSSIKQGIMYSALGGEQSQSRQVMQSDEYQKATPAVKATMLAEAAQQDAQNPDVVKNVANAVREDRIAKQMGVLMANGAAEKIGQAEVKVDFAKLETQKAQKGLDTQRGIEKTAREKQQSMVAESVQNPNNKQMAQDAENAMRDLIDQAKVTREYEQSVKNAQQREDDAVRNAEKVRQKTLSDIRKQAEQYVAQEDQQRAAVAEQQRVEQEQQAVVAEQQRIAQEEKSNATNADAEAFIEKNLPNGTEEDKQKIREMFKKISTETPAQETRDQNGNLTAEAVLNRGKVLNRISKKFNIRIDEEDTTHNGTVSRQNGYYDVKNNRIVIDRNTSLGDAMFFVLGHELTHVAEKSSTYKELANALLKIAYGDGADYESIIKDATAGKPTSKAVADILARKALYDERLAEMHKQDNSINGDPITYEEALQEVVADITGKILNGDENLINQLASKTPGIARRIIESIKNFVKKARGIDGEWKTKAQNAVDLLEKALKDAEKQTEHKTKFSLDNPVEELDNGLIATHSLKYDDIRKMRKFTGIPAPSIGVSQISKRTGAGFFGPITFVFHKSTIDPGASPDNYAFGRDAWTPTFPETKKGLLGTRFVQDNLKVTAENAVDIMKSKPIQNGVYSNQFWDAETPDFTDNSTMAHHIASELAKQYKSIEEIQADRERFGSKSQEEINQTLDDIAKGFDGLKEKVISEIEASGRNIDELYEDRNEGMAREFVQAFKVVASGDQDSISYLGLSPETVSEIKSFVDQLQNIPVSYAEAKPMRVVDWGEVMAAAVPSDAPSDVVDFLESKGIQVEYYDDQNGRAKTLNNSDVVRNLKFSLPETTVIASDDQGDALAEELPGGTVAVNINRKYSLSSFSDKEQKRVRQALLDSGRFSKEQVDKYLTDALGIASKIADERQRLDFEANPAQQFLKPNNDYYFTLDASTLCAKRLLYQGTFDYVQHELPDEVFTPEDLIDLVNIMSDMGYETPCGICYVESRRRWLDTYAQKFLDDIQKDADSFIEKRFKKASDEEKAALRERFAGELPSIEDLTTSDGLERLRTSDPLMHKAFVAAMNAKGTANPKVVQLRTEYRGDIGKLTDKDIQKVKDIGGLRIQSFSDFETPHLLDMVQAVLDMSSVGLTSQAYTKVPNFAWVFGDTGIKINLSLIGKGTGLDADGNLVFDNVEGMNFDEAMKLRERYSKNVGTILVGINDDHIIAAMADSRIDFIIPFHKSGWSDTEMKGIPSLNHYKDYTDSQNEKKLFGKDKDGNWIRNSDGSYKTIPGKESKLKNFEPVGAHKYWEFKHDGEWNARKYLKMCAKDGRIPKFSQFLVDNGDGSFSLPEGDDKRSVAIRTGYWKTLIDFKMYDNDGNGAEQTAVTPNINMDQAYRVLKEHKLGRQMPDRDGKKGAFIPMESNNDTPVAVPAGDAFIEKIRQKRRGNKPSGPNDTLKATPPTIEVTSKKSAFHQNDETAQGVPNARSAAMASNADLTLGNTETNQEEAATVQQQMAIDAETGETVQSRKYSLPSDAPYMAAVERGNMETAQKDVDRIAEQAFRDSKVRSADGSLLKMYHGTNADFTVFQRDKIGSTGRFEGSGFNFTPYEGRASSYGKNVLAGYLDIQKPLSAERKTISVQELAKIIRETDPTGDNIIANYARNTNDYGSESFVRRESMTAARQIWNYSNNDVDIYSEISSADPDAESLIAKFSELGYDGLIHYDDSGKIKTAVAFSSEQFKSSEPVTYDDNGKVIPLSQRFDTGNEDIRYSLPSDAPYMAAVERGEMDVAQRMVDEAAEKAGYIYGKVYHGTPNKEFTEFKDGFVFFTSNKDTADEYQNPGQMWATRYDKGRTIGAYIKLDNPLILDNSYSDYRNEHTPWQEWKPTVYGRVPDNAMNAQEVAKRAKELGYDGVIIRNDKDTKWADSDKYLKKRGRGDTIIAFSAEQIKSSDPITYDDQGRVIPLSERFDTGKKDFRYSLPSDDILEDMIKQYLRKGGVLSENEDVANRDAALVKDGVVPLKQMAKMLKTDKGDGTRQWGTGMAQNMDELADQARQFVLDHSAYQRDTNKAQIDRAVAWVKKLPTHGNETTYDKAVSYVTSDAFRRGGARTADGRAKLAVVMGMAVARNDASAQVLIADMTNKTATNIGQALQAQKLFKLMTPEGRIGTLQRLLDDQKVALQRRGKNAVAENLKFSDWVIRAAGLAETEADMKQVRDAALNELAQQIPMNWKDRLTSFRMLSMLFNPRTHIRNFDGNALFVPAVGMKNKLAAIVEAMTLEKGERTKTLAPILNKSIREFARMDAETMKETLTGEAKFNESGSLVARQQKGLAKWNGNLLELEDWFFMKGHYRRALGGWMQANGYTVEDVKNNPQLLEKGRAYAIEEAQKATYRDFSKTADALNKISKQGGALGFVVDAALPFKKTPINILRRGIEYSPVGIAKGLKNLMFHMNEYTEYQKALEAYEAGETTTAPVMPDKAVSPNQVIDQICAGLSGTAIMTLGFLLAGCGAVTCGLDDDEDKFDKAKGEQEYSIKLFGTDVSMTIDWAAPMCMPFFVGAAIREQAEKENLDIEALINAFGGITEPVFNLSMLDGVNTLLKTNSYDKTNPIAQIGSKLALNYAGSFVPSALGALARTIDDNQRKAFVPGDQKGVVSNAMYTLEQAQNKIPFYNQQNIAARNIWGEEKTSSFIERLVENFISPGYFNKVEDDPIINEMGRLYDVTGDNKMIPDEDPDKKITFTKDKVKQEVVLTDKQWDEYKRVRGQTAKQELTELINSESYQNASNSAKLQMMKDVLDHAENVGKNAVVSDIEVDNKPVSQIAKESKIAGYESEMIKYLNNGDFEDYDNVAEAIRQEYDDEEDADAEIRHKLMNYYDDMYKKAYRNGGLEGQTKMNEIEEALEYTGLVDESDFMRWQNAVDKALDNET